MKLHFSVQVADMVLFVNLPAMVKTSDVVFGSPVKFTDAEKLPSWAIGMVPVKRKLPPEVVPTACPAYEQLMLIWPLVRPANPRPSGVTSKLQVSFCESLPR